ncbi:lipid A deacylase LpxR family protein [Parasulfuritortus cantonensis]|uniref:lipid A deacylase LpxR family protein n=1 Tax=Parasulfuritortus cantonensis TaxID=2528202 RepID=UPI001F114EF7|nr:lipid A deacylase LpxR family protein [Parasulfuritortus cantonensis]
MTRAPGLLALLLLATAAPLAAAAEAEPAGTLSVVLENDLFYDVDRHYTNGVGFVWVPDRRVATPDWAVRLAHLLPWFPEQGTVRHGYAFGQSMFTPGDITVADPSRRDRPYAGWLYGTFGLGTANRGRLDLCALSVGMVGPASLAEQSQTLVHKLIGADEPQGWDTQIGNEPGFVLTYLRSQRALAATPAAGLHLDLTPQFGAALGNVFTYADAGLTVRLGKRLPDDFGPPRIQPGLLGSGEFVPAPGFSWYLFAGLEGRAVARNIFLDGNSFRHSRRVDRKTLVGDLQYGIVLDWDAVRLTYTHVHRTREFRSQDGHDQFGAFSLSVKL